MTDDEYLARWHRIISGIAPPARGDWEFDLPDPRHSDQLGRVVERSQLRQWVARLCPDGWRVASLWMRDDGRRSRVRVKLRRIGGETRGIVGRWYVTESAVRDYQRCMRGHELAFGEAQADLIEIANTANHIRDQENGLALWRAKGKPRLRLLVAPPNRDGDKPVLVKVLPESLSR